MLEWLLYLAVGALSGIVAGLFGVGGGTVIVPALLASFAVIGMNPDVAMHAAVGTSLATIVVSGSSAALTHARKGAVSWRTLQYLLGGIVVGVWLGGYVASDMSGTLLKRLFGGFLLVMAIVMFSKNSALQLTDRDAKLDFLQPLAGLIIGFISALFGIGGGALTVPWLTARGASIKRAVATSSACGVPIALVGAISYIYNGWTVTADTPGLVGYIYWPALLALVVTGAIFSNVGAKLAHRLKATLLRKMFALFMLFVGTILIF